MPTVQPGRFTASIEGPFIVFVVGMHINKWTALRQWVPTFLAMLPMLRDLQARPASGFLGGQTYLHARGVALVQYWRSFEQLDAFARDPQKAHLPSWRRFNRLVSAGRAVGVFHETYLVADGQHEEIYANMPPYGLAAATSSVPALGRRETAARRLGFHDEPAVPTPTA
jgi:hypothetical protein